MSASTEDRGIGERDEEKMRKWTRRVKVGEEREKELCGISENEIS